MGEVKPVCCKPPRYGHHKSEVLRKLCNKLKANDMVKNDDGPWGAMIVLAAKPGQDDVPWFNFVWRLCISYRKLNQITRPFRFPLRQCDDAVLNIGNGRYRISIDMDSGRLLCVGGGECGCVGSVLVCAVLLYVSVSYTLQLGWHPRQPKSTSSCQINFRWKFRVLGNMPMAETDAAIIIRKFSI
jgi:hypothetical protein